MKIARDNRSLAMIRFLFDEYMFRLFPREFPAAVMALLVPLMFLSIYQWGIIIGLLVDVALVFGSTRLRQDSIVKALSRIQIGVAVGIILTLLWSYYTFITEFMSNTYDTIVLIISPLIFITLYLASYTQADSLLPRVKRSRLYQKIVRAGYKEGMTELENNNTIGDDLYKNIWALKKTQSSSIQAIETITDHLALNLDINSDDDDDDDNACSESLLQPATKQPTRLCASCLCDKSEGSTHCFVSEIVSNNIYCYEFI